LETFNADSLNATTKAVAVHLGVGIGVLVHPMRLVCTGRTVGPSLYHLMEVLGKERVVARFDGVLGKMG
jgi:glutamyl/glutaminyl-tRNA synthetase